MPYLWRISLVNIIRIVIAYHSITLHFSRYTARESEAIYRFYRSSAYSLLRSRVADSRISFLLRVGR